LLFQITHIKLTTAESIMSYASENVVPALLLVLGAGASTGLGAAVVFVPKLVKLASRRVLAASLGFSAGVMTYVSFIEIFAKSNDSFVNAGHDENKAYIYATLCFFGGVVTMLVLNAMVDLLVTNRKGHGHHEEAPTQTNKSAKECSDKQPVDGVEPSCCSSDPVKQLNDVHRMASALTHEIDDADKATGDVQTSEENEENVDIESPEKSEEAQRLHKMGLNTAIAIGLHNFPEGLATFVAALEDPKVGAVLAIAIAIHNVPEGLCVALPIYYASGNRMKGFLWALLSGASEFVAALLGWAVLATVFSESAYAILFGLVAGMMVMISVRELLPTAHNYDQGDTVVTNSFILGMIVMALSLCLFQL